MDIKLVRHRLLYSFAEIFGERFLEKWFRYLGWISLVATFVVIGERADSSLILAIGILSAFALGIHLCRILMDWLYWVGEPLGTHIRLQAVFNLAVCIGVLAVMIFAVSALEYAIQFVLDQRQ